MAKQALFLSFSGNAPRGANFFAISILRQPHRHPKITKFSLTLELGGGVLAPQVPSPRDAPDDCTRAVNAVLFIFSL